MAGADLTRWWARDGSVRSYVVNRLGVEILVTVTSDEPEFVKRLNAILDREISAVLAGETPPPSSNR